MFVLNDIVSPVWQSRCEIQLISLGFSLKPKQADLRQPPTPPCWNCEVAQLLNDCVCVGVKTTSSVYMSQLPQTCMYTFLGQQTVRDPCKWKMCVCLFLIAVVANASWSIVRIEFGVCVYCIFILVSTRCGCMELSHLNDVSSAVFWRYAALIRELKKSSSVFVYRVCLFSRLVSTVVLEKTCEKEIMNCRGKKKSSSILLVFYCLWADAAGANGRLTPADWCCCWQWWGHPPPPRPPPWLLDEGESRKKGRENPKMPHSLLMLQLCFGCRGSKDCGRKTSGKQGVTFFFPFSFFNIFQSPLWNRWPHAGSSKAVTS